jgi:SAM-dependent methyltransferase
MNIENTAGEAGAMLDLFGQSAREAAIDVLHAATAIYTREPIVDQLLDSIDWPSAGRTLVDSSCGDGAFLGRALQRLLTQRPTISDDQVRAVLGGWEIHPFAAGEARQRLRQVLVDHGRPVAAARALADSMVHCADFLTEGPHTRFDVIIGNPPYLRFVNVPQPLRSEYEAVLPDYAQADLLHSFLDRCARLLAPDGELAFVTADRWLFNAGAARLREVVGQRFGLARVQRLDVTSAFYRPKLRKAGTPPRIHPVSVVLKPRGAGATLMGRAPIFPGEAPYVVKPAAAGTLGDIAEVRLAPWLGTPGVFVVDAATAQRLPSECLVPAVESDDITGGLLRTPQRFAIRTRPGEAPALAVQQHLARTMPSMCARGRRRGQPWTPPEPFHDFDLSQASLLVPRIAKSVRAVRLPAGYLPVSHNISIVRAGRWSLQAIGQLLDSPEANDWVRHHAAPLENGYYSLTTRLLRTLPLFDGVVAEIAEASA